MQSNRISAAPRGILSHKVQSEYGEEQTKGIDWHRDTQSGLLLLTHEHSPAKSRNQSLVQNQPVLFIAG
ncbi:hypothetical protein NST74_27965 [Paenibacillus sp. FSL F4-0125]|uniref:hypothetical protein n=1 Tax=Paenibacillus sp. FSL F4-0125 TaxID=2954730 RepID=UPI0030F5D576